MTRRDLTECIREVFIEALRLEALPALPRMYTRATITDVAAEAGVSISTVSLVMNGKGAVADADAVARADGRDAAGLHALAHARAGWRPAGRATSASCSARTTSASPSRSTRASSSGPSSRRGGAGSTCSSRPSRRATARRRAALPAGAHGRRRRRRRPRGRRVPRGAGTRRASRSSSPTTRGTARASVQLDNEGGAALVAAHLVAQGHTRVGFLGADRDHPSMAARARGLPPRDGGGRPRRRGPRTRDEHGRGGPPRRRRARRPPSRRPDRADGRLLRQRRARARLARRRPRPRPRACPADLAVVGFDDVEGAALADDAAHDRPRVQGAARRGRARAARRALAGDGRRAPRRRGSPARPP